MGSKITLFWSFWDPFFHHFGVLQDLFGPKLEKSEMTPESLFGPKTEKKCLLR